MFSDLVKEFLLGGVDSLASSELSGLGIELSEHLVDKDLDWSLSSLEDESGIGINRLQVLDNLLLLSEVFFVLLSHGFWQASFAFHFQNSLGLEVSGSSESEQQGLKEV